MEPQPVQPPRRDLPPLEFKLTVPPAFRLRFVLACLAIYALCLGGLWWSLTLAETGVEMVKASVIIVLSLALLLPLSLALPELLWRSLTGPVVLRIDTQGLTVLKIGLIPWEDIGEYRFDGALVIRRTSKEGVTRESRTLRVAVLSPQRYRARLSWLARLNWANELTWGKKELAFNDTFLSKPATMIAAGIEAHRALARVVAQETR